MKRMRKGVLLVLLMITTVVAPILLYTTTEDDQQQQQEDTSSATATKLTQDTLASSSSSSSSSLKFGTEMRKLNLLHQEPLNDLKEPIRIIYPSSSSSSNSSTNSISQSQPQELPLPATDHITRVLSSSSTNNVDVDDDNPIDPLKDNSINLITTTTIPHKPTTHFTLSANKGGTTKESIQTSGKVKRKERRQNDVDNTNDQMVAIQDARVRHLKDQLIRARVYLSLGATRNSPHFIKDLRLRMKEVQRALGDATKDSELPKNAYDKLKAMEQTLAKGKQIQDDCTAVVKKLRAILHSTEEQLRVHKKQTMFLTQLAAKTLPKGLHCLPLRLSTEYYSLNSSQQQFPNNERLEDPELYHYAIFSDNILAAAAVVNSTVFHAQVQENHVFHIVTDRLNYAAMRMWFLANQPGKATIQVQNIEELTWLNSSYSPVLKQLGSPSMIDYYFKGHRASSDMNLKFRNPKYLSILNHLRFYLPEIFPKLKKVLFLDDDIVVQKDLTSLWSLDLKGKVNGAVETCREGFHRFDRYLNFSNPLISKNFDPRACGWAYGMNIFDLEEWKRQNITEVYHSWQKLNEDRQLWKLGTLPPGLITFWKQTFALDRSWHVLGLGYNPNVNLKEIERAAVIHYNGNMKPWLEIGIPKYRGYWAKYVDYDQVYLRDCNINP